jgi:integrase/recombinase XerD
VKNASYEFASVLAPEFQGYFALRESQGHQHTREFHYFKRLDQYIIEKNVTEKSITAPIIEGWVQSLPSEMSVNTKIVYISHYSQFAKYLNTLGIAAFTPERPMDDKSYMPYVFTEGEIARLFSAADNLVNNGNDFGLANLEFPLIMRILYGCGLRLNEALCLLVGDFDLHSGTLLIRSAKGNKDRLVPMDSTLANILNKYVSLNHRDSSKDALLFSTRKGERHSDAIIRFWFNKSLEAAGIEKPTLPRYSRNICLHCLRHTFAVHSFRKQDLEGVDMYAAEPFLSAYMGHTRLYGTETYLHMTAENSADVIEKTTAYTDGLFPEVPR